MDNADPGKRAAAMSERGRRQVLVWIVCVAALLTLLALATRITVFVGSTATAVNVFDRRLFDLVDRGAPLPEVEALLDREPHLVSEVYPGIGTILHVNDTLSRPELVELLLDRGADPSFGCENMIGKMWTPLDVAAVNHKNDSARKLVEMLRRDHRTTVLQQARERAAAAGNAELLGVIDTAIRTEASRREAAE